MSKKKIAKEMFAMVIPLFSHMIVRGPLWEHPETVAQLRNSLLWHSNSEPPGPNGLEDPGRTFCPVDHLSKLRAKDRELNMKIICVILYI